MPVQRLLYVLLVIFLLITAQACTGAEDKQQEATFKQLPELQEIKPAKPAKIKLKRNAKGSYSWDISGIDVEAVIKADKRLRETLEEGKGLNSKFQAPNNK